MQHGVSYDNLKSRFGSSPLVRRFAALIGPGPVVARRAADDRDRPAGAVHPARLIAGGGRPPERFSRHKTTIFTTPMR